jgi:8-oxo-dGTP pyrophosphatase MutT (NUDIX family)
MDENKNPWTTLKTNEVYDNPWINITQSDVLNPNGNPGIYGVVHFKNLAIGIVPLDDEGNTWIVGQYRYPLNEYSWEIPEGGGEIDVDPLISAKRELSEETGILANRWTKIQEFNTSNSCTDEKSILYLAQDLTFNQAHPDDNELLVIKKISIIDLYQKVISSEIKDSLTVVAVYKIAQLIRSGKINVSNEIFNYFKNN